jgi:hypothetical protein
MARMVLCDSETDSVSWRGIEVEIEASRAELIAGFQTGDMVRMTAFVREEPWGSNNSRSILRIQDIHRVGTGAVPAPSVRKVTDFYAGSYPDGPVNYVVGEQYEGMRVELRDLIVDSAPDPVHGNTELTDRAGNSFTMVDLGRWWTVRSHRDPASTYVPPAPGTHISRLRGFVTTVPGPMNARGYGIIPVDSSDLVVGTAGNGSISGRLFVDSDHDAVWDPSEPTTIRGKVYLTGKMNLTALTDSDGVFRFRHLDAGSYLISSDLPAGWANTVPDPDYLRKTISANDTSFTIDMGRYFQGNAAIGSVFLDHNGNGTRDSGDADLPGWPVALRGPAVHSLSSDQAGYFQFDSLPAGTYTIEPAESLYWHQTVPPSHSNYTVTVGPQNLVSSGNDIGMQYAKRIRLDLNVRDNSTFAQRDIWWGVRPGARFGIWGVDPGATAADSSEREEEIPPRLFVKTMGIFDARFTEPGAELNVEAPRFGEGSWSDVRQFLLPSQVDTFFVSFLPGYFYDGDYPMRLRWSKRAVGLAYSGAVRLVDRYGNATDMKSVDNLTITNRTIEWLNLIAEGPNLPDAWRERWHLVSVAATAADQTVKSLFPAATTPAYGFDPALGYVVHEDIAPGPGYWLKRHHGADDSPHVPSDTRLKDTLELSAGWNLIGSLSAPLDAGSLTTIPSGAGLGDPFGFEAGYQSADTLAPGMGYWIHADGACSLILDAHAPITRKTASGRDFDGDGAPNVIEFRDANGATGRLYYHTGKISAGGPGLLPPRPPAGVFDVRFSTNRFVESAGRDASSSHTIELTDAVYPLTVRWNFRPESPQAQLLTTQSGLPLADSGSAVIPEPEGISGLRTNGISLMTLVISAAGHVPDQYSLAQNFPNPFNPTTTIEYAIPVDGRVTIRVYNTLGELVSTPVDDHRPAGIHQALFDGNNLPSGVYYYRIVTGQFSTVRKMLLVK